MLRIDRRVVAHIDWTLLGLTLLIPAFGLTVLYSAGFDPDNTTRAFSWLPAGVPSMACMKQAVFCGVGLIVMLLGMSVSTGTIARVSPFVYLVSVLLLVLVLEFGVVVKGSRRWLDFGALNLQPAELMKLGVVLGLAKYCSKYPPRSSRGYTLPELIIPALLILVPMVLIMRQPDLGSALSVGICGFGIILFLGVRLRTVVSLLASIAALAYPAWHMLHDYQQRRILVLLDPEADPQGSGYHIIQSKIAVGSGSAFGKGFLQGTQTQLEFLPEHTTDFVFSVLAEEWGFVGSLMVILLFFGLIAEMLRIALRSRDLFGCLLTIGFTTQVFANVTINIGMVIGLMPVVGIPLPLFSYGGSALLSLFLALGLVQGVSMRRTAFP